MRNALLSSIWIIIIMSPLFIAVETFSAGSDSLVYTVDDPSGTPVSGITTVGNLVDLGMGADSVDDTEIDFGTGVNQVGLADIPFTGNWKVPYSNGSAVWNEIALGVAGTFLGSTGTAAAPGFMSDISANWEVQDSINFSFGNDDDISMAWETIDGTQTIAASLMWVDSSDNAKMWFIPASNSFNVAATETPEVGLYDSGAATSDTNLVDVRADQYAGGIGANINEPDDEGDWISNFFIYVMLDDDPTPGGDTNDNDAVKTLVAEWVGSDEAWVLGDSGTGEDLVIDFETATDNEVGVSSNSGVTAINFNTIALRTTGTITGKIDIEESSAATLAIATEQHYGGVAANGDPDAIEMDLNAAVVGMSIVIVDNAGGAITLDPNGTDTIVYDGTAAAAGEAIISSGAKGDFAALICLSANQWLVLGHDSNGWTEASP